MPEGFKLDSDTSNAPSNSTPPQQSNNTSIGGLFDNVSPFDSAQAAHFNEAAHKLKNLASNKGFAINDAGFIEYKKLCDQFIDGYNAIKPQLRVLTKNAALGDFPYANAVATFNVKIATGATDSLMPNLDLMNDGYLRAREALEIAHKNYNEADDEASKCFAKTRREI